MRTAIRSFLTAGLMLLLLPLLGVLASGRDVRVYLEFPPVTRHVEQAGFSWVLFVLMVLVQIGVYGFFVWALRRAARTSAARVSPVGSFPWWGWAGLGLGLAAWVLAWTRFAWFAPLQRHTFFPLWFAYILVVNAVCRYLRGTCPMTAKPWFYAALFPASAFFWWFFEYLNRFVQNWYYVGIGEYSTAEYILLGSLSFSTVLPAVLATVELLKAFPLLNDGLARLPRVRLPRPRLLGWLALPGAGVGLALIGVLPNIMYPLLWLSPLIIIVGIQLITGSANLLTPLRDGDWRGLMIPALAALICGFFWEMWNVFSLAQWEYAVPFVHRFEVFRMPILGYAGYLPFGLECMVLIDVLRRARLEAAPTAPPDSTPPWYRRLLRLAAAAAVFLVITRVIPLWWCGRPARDLYEGKTAPQLALANGLENWTTTDLDRTAFATGSARFDGEWLFGTYTMTAMGLGQVALAQPELRDTLQPGMLQCLRSVLKPRTRAFDRTAWGNDPITSLDDLDSHHAAFLGYYNLALSLYCYVFQPPADDQMRQLNERITAALAHRLEQSKLLMLQTYPDEVYPVDNSAVIASIGLHTRAGGRDCRGLVRRWSANCRRMYVDPRTGLLIQAVHPLNGEAIDAPRGSGTALAVYFLYFADPELSKDLFGALQRELFGTVNGFGAVREYPAGHNGSGDIDSGPIVFGYGASATGFTIAGCRLHGDFQNFRKLYATAHLWGAPVTRDKRTNWVSGGPIGDAILFAMLTAPRQPLEPLVR